MAVRYSEMARKKIACSLHKTTMSEELAMLNYMSTFTAWSRKQFGGGAIAKAACFACESNQGNGREHLGVF